MNAPMKEPGRISRTLIRLMMKHARVADSEAIGEGLRLIIPEVAMSATFRLELK